MKFARHLVGHVSHGSGRQWKVVVGRGSAVLGRKWQWQAVAVMAVAVKILVLLCEIGGSGSGSDGSGSGRQEVAVDGRKWQWKAVEGRGRTIPGDIPL